MLSHASVFAIAYAQRQQPIRKPSPTGCIELIACG
jgi:hypothetical protein